VDLGNFKALKDVLRPRAVFAAVGLDFLAVHVTGEAEVVDPREGADSAGARPVIKTGGAGLGQTKGASTGHTGTLKEAVSLVLSKGRFHDRERPHTLRAWEELSGVRLRQLVAGAFHCVALSTRGEVFTFGHQQGQDISNGDLLGQGMRRLPSPIPPMALPGLPPVAEVAATTYGTITITVDGRVFSWGDCDGGALGHGQTPCHTPHWIADLGQVSHMHMDLRTHIRTYVRTHL
jgi:hypothetical protein